MRIHTSYFLLLLAAPPFTSCKTADPSETSASQSVGKEAPDFGSLENLKKSLDAKPLNTASQYAEQRRRLGGASGALKLKQLMTDAGLIDGDELSPDGKPFTFAAYVTGALRKFEFYDARTHDVKPYDPETGLGTYAGKFMAIRNRPDQDKNWDQPPADEGKASMAMNHVLLVPRDRHWSLFNVLTFGYGGPGHDVSDALKVLDDMEAAAKLYASAQKWDLSQLRLVFHAFPHNSVPYLHLHVVDGATLGNAWKHHAYKNLPLDEVRRALRDGA